jgi:CubicO group peptidase (beta-lactamase class C family)
MLIDHHLNCDPDAGYFYSNVGFGLLGHALARRAGMDFQQLLEARITGPWAWQIRELRPLRR